MDVSGAVDLGTHEASPDKLPLPARSKYIRRAGVALTSTNNLMTKNLIRSFSCDKTLNVSKYATAMQQPVNRKGAIAAKFNRLMKLLVPPKGVLSTAKMKSQNSSCQPH